MGSKIESLYKAVTGGKPYRTRLNRYSRTKHPTIKYVKWLEQKLNENFWVFGMGKQSLKEKK